MPKQKTYAYMISQKYTGQMMDQGVVKAANKIIAKKKLQRKYGKRFLIDIGFETGGMY